MAMRKAILTLHRKLDGKRECICGSKLDLIGGDWVCRRQYKLKEESQIEIEFKPLLGVDLGRNRGDHSCKIQGVKINDTVHIISCKVWMEDETY